MIIVLPRKSATGYEMQIGRYTFSFCTLLGGKRKWYTFFKRFGVKKYTPTSLTDRQTKLLEVACSILDEVGLYNLNLNNYNKNGMLTYDGVENDTACLAEDIRIEFGLEE